MTQAAVAGTKGLTAAAARNVMTNASKFVADPRRFVDPRFPATDHGPLQAILDGLRDADEWLRAQGNRPSGADLDHQIQLLCEASDNPNVGALTSSGNWQSAIDAMTESLSACLIVARPDSGQQGWNDFLALASTLTRRLLVAGLVEWRVTNPAIADASAIYAALHDRTVTLPGAAAGSGGSSAAARGVLARSPGFSDLYVVKSEWSCYVAGEIAHIDNVMSGELRRRRHMRLDETETTQTTDVYSDTTEERDTQTTDRFTLDAQASTETQLKLNIAASVDTSGQYGPTHVNTHVGGSFDYSDDESRKVATNQAHEIVTRAVSKVEQSVRDVRTTRTLNRIRETNLHSYDATHIDHHIVGMYRWVDKIERLQIFRYPHRYVLEFEIPEPSASYVWASELASQAAASAPPTPFTIDGTPAGRPLTLADVTPATYAELAARYGASELTPPPAEQVVVESSFTLEADPPDYATLGQADVNLRVGPEITKTTEVALPDGYHTISMVASASAAPAHAQWGDWLDADHRFEWRYGYHYPRVDITIGNTVVRLEDVRRPTVQNAIEFKDAWLSMSSPLAALSPIIEKATIGVTAAGSFRVTVSVDLTCVVNDEHVVQWSADTYTKIRAAYDSAQQAYSDSSASMFGTSSGLGSSDPPELNAAIVVEELKRQVVELLLGEPFNGYDDLVRPPGQRPHLDPVRVAATTPYIQMFEQAFEWENITYIFYPYFWADQARWNELAARRSTDPDFLNFLRAGSARVVVPARPGFEPTVNAFLQFGVIWGGGPAPGTDDPEYMSIADEIRAREQAPPDGEGLDSWEVRLPTTLVWLDPDSTLPKVNPHRQLTAPADPVCP
jgi:hypothetical protein